MEAETTAGLGSIAKRMSGGALSAVAALFGAVIVQRICGFPVFRDVGATVGVPLLLSGGWVAMVAHRRADAVWALGALAALPVAWLFAFFVSDPALAADASDFAMFARGNSVILPAIFVGVLLVCAAALVVRLLQTRVHAVVIAGAAMALVVCCALGAPALLAPRPLRIEDWRAVEARLSRPNALRDARAEVGDDTSRFVSIDPGPLFARAYVVRLPVSENREAEFDWRGPEAIIARVHGRLVEVEGCVTTLPDDGLAVIFVSGRGVLFWSQPWPRRGGVGCSLGADGSFDRLTASRAGFGARLGAPREAGWLVVLAATIGGLGLFAALRARARSRRLESLQEVTLMVAPDAMTAMALLPGGELIRLAGRVPTVGARIFVPHASDPSGVAYRVDPRPTIADWVETREPRDTVVASLRRQAAQLEAMALFTMLWLATPAACAAVMGIRLSCW